MPNLGFPPPQDETCAAPAPLVDHALNKQNMDSLKICFNWPFIHAGTLNGLSKSIVNASKEALNSIDLSKHEGGHPRKGAIDLIPIHPLNESTSLEECGELALCIGENLHQTHRELKIFNFGHADLPQKRDLVKRRKEIGWFNVIIFNFFCAKSGPLIVCHPL